MSCDESHPYSFARGKKCCSVELKSDGSKLGYFDSDSDCAGTTVDCDNPSGGNCVDGNPKMVLTDEETVQHVLLIKGNKITDYSFDPVKAPPKEFNLDFVATDPDWDSTFRSYSAVLLPDNDTIVMVGGLRATDDTSIDNVKKYFS